jgi:hypothetical protein
VSDNLWTAREMNVEQQSLRIDASEPRSGLYFTSICFDRGLQGTCDVNRQHLLLLLLQQDRKQLRVLSLIGLGNETADGEG